MYEHLPSWHVPSHLSPQIVPGCPRPSREESGTLTFRIRVYLYRWGSVGEKKTIELLNVDKFMFSFNIDEKTLALSIKRKHGFLTNKVPTDIVKGQHRC